MQRSVFNYCSYSRENIQTLTHFLTQKFVYSDIQPLRKSIRPIGILHTKTLDFEYLFLSNHKTKFYEKYINLKEITQIITS